MGGIEATTTINNNEKENQMHISQLKQSKFLTKADVGRGVLATIKEVFEDNIAKEGAPQDMKWCIQFEELEKPLVLNSTNGQLIAQILKSENSDGWIGHKVVLYDEPTVSYAGKVTGGIRIRAPRNQPAPAKAAARPQAPRQTAPAPEPQPEAPPANWQPSDNDGGAGEEPVPF